MVHSVWKKALQALHTQQQQQQPLLLASASTHLVQQVLSCDWQVVQHQVDAVLVVNEFLVLLRYSKQPVSGVHMLECCHEQNCRGGARFTIQVAGTRLSPTTAACDSRCLTHLHILLGQGSVVALGLTRVLSLLLFLQLQSPVW